MDEAVNQLSPDHRSNSSKNQSTTPEHQETIIHNEDDTDRQEETTNKPMNTDVTNTISCSVDKNGT